MNWLLDAHLPPSLCQWLRAKGDQAVHVESLKDGRNLPDEAIWAHAKQNHLIIVSKDSDFFDRAILSGQPPQVVFVTVGNCSNKALLAILDQFWLHIRNALLQGASLVEVGRNKIRAY
ncbi:MAG: DUF5615 family PIN-like protein [Ignavibacteriae bacterium]|nr:DUF5615 family PIN-like protein [Ignavibacteriota bacterium]